MIFTDTIVASATPIGAPTALSVIRISGPLSKDILSPVSYTHLTLPTNREV